MLLLDTALKHYTQPPLEQRGDVVNARHDFVAVLVYAGDDRNAMRLARIWEAGISSRTCVKGIPSLDFCDV